MASYFGEIIEPSTRALFEDCSDEESEIKTTIDLVFVDSYQESLPDFHTFVVVYGRLALAFAEAFVIDSSHTLIGEVKYIARAAGRDENREIAKSPLILQGDLLICFVQTSVPASAAFDFAEAVSSISEKSKEVIIVTNDTLCSYKSQPNEISCRVNSVFCLKTQHFQSPTLRPVLNEANILSGIPAGVLSWCEIYDVPAVVYVCYSDSDTLDSVTAKPLRGILPCRNQSPDLKRQWMYGGGNRVVGALSNMYM